VDGHGSGRAVGYGDSARLQEKTSWEGSQDSGRRDTWAGIRADIACSAGIATGRGGGHWVTGEWEGSGMLLLLGSFHGQNLPILHRGLEEVGCATCQDV